MGLGLLRLKKKALKFTSVKVYGLRVSEGCLGLV